MRQMPIVFIRLRAYGIVRHTQVEIQYRGTARSCRRSAQPRNASTMMAHAIRNAVKPMQTVKINMAIKSKYSIYQMMSLACKMELAEYHIGEDTSQLTLAMKMRPPETRQKDDTSSDGGREAKAEVGGERKNKI
jgi:hypothetical protein